MKTVKGKFEVKMIPSEASSVMKELSLMHMKFEKIFEGSLSAKGVVSMMGILNKDIGSGGYVAIEKISGELDSKKGTFLFQHSSIMDKGNPKQTIIVIPDSGTDDLKGLRGEMVIDIIQGQHFYTFNFELK